VTGDEPNTVQRVFAHSPGALEAIKQRGLDHPEYRAWLEQFARGVLAAAEQSQGPAEEAGSPAEGV
jgi:hypothetical protein